jgi:hypothetical protein
MSRLESERKKVLFIQYSQSGQLTRIVDRVKVPLDKSEHINTKVITLEPVNPFPFPWPVLKFFNIFPECVYLEPIELKPVDLDPDEKFDLIVFSYQVWFLSPSLPATSFLKSKIAKDIFKDTPVITLIGCRNMWTQAQQTVTDLLDRCGARLIDNIVLVDQASTMASFITTPRWLMTGRSNAFWRLPAAGISEDEVNKASRFGEAIADGLAGDLEISGQPMLYGLGAAKADVALIQSEKIGYRSFLIWGRLLRFIGTQDSLPRKMLLILYIVFLVCMILTVVPMILLIRKCMAPFLKSRHQQLREKYEQPSGSDLDRMEKYTCQH